MKFSVVKLSALKVNGVFVIRSDAQQTGHDVEPFRVLETDHDAGRVLGYVYRCQSLLHEKHLLLFASPEQQNVLKVS